MSSGNEDRKFQFFRGRRCRGSQERLDSSHFAQAISAALRLEFGGTHAAVKTIARQTGANQRAAKNWLEAKNSPSARSLVELCRHSDRVFETVVCLAGRDHLLKVKKLLDARQKLREILELLDELETCAPVDRGLTWPQVPWVGRSSGETS